MNFFRSFYSFRSSYLVLTDDEDMLRCWLCFILIGDLTVMIDPGCSVCGEQSVVLRHTHRLSLLKVSTSVHGDCLPTIIRECYLCLCFFCLVCRHWGTGLGVLVVGMKLFWIEMQQLFVFGISRNVALVVGTITYSSSAV